MAQPGFIFGGNTGMSYDQIQKQRDIANELLRANMSTPQNVGEGLSAIGRALAAKAIDKRTSRADNANRQASEARRADAFGSIFGASAPSASPSPFSPAAPASPAAGVADDTMTALGKTPMRPFRDAIASIESAGSGDYAAVGPTNPRLGRALGRYQIMEANIGPWSREVLGREVTPDEFLANPQLQDAIFDGKFGGYVEQFGPEGAAQAWFAGPGGVGKMDRQDVLGTSVADYTRKFSAALGGGAPAPAGNMSMGNPANIKLIADLLADPYTPPGEKAMLEQAMAMALQGMDPMRQMEMERARLELDNLKNPQPGFRNMTDEEEAAAGLDPSGVYQQGQDGSINTIQAPAKGAARPMTAEERAAWGISPEDKTPYGIGSDGFPKPIGGKDGVTVNNNIAGDGVPPADEDLRGELMKSEGKAWGDYLKAGSTASGMQQDMQLLTEVIELAPSGPISGRLAEMFPGVSDAAGVFQSVVKRVAPSLRVEGSGSQSDIEYNGFLQSLPALQNRPEANRAIASFLKSKAQINMDRAAAVAAYQNGEISAVDARKQIAEIDSRSIMSPEIEGLLGKLDQGGGEAGPAPDGVEQEVWDVMTDEERALFQ